jgi:hypothetical protein
VLLRQSGDQSWWLGYVDTGGADTVFLDALRGLGRKPAEVEAAL